MILKRWLLPLGEVGLESGLGDGYTSVAQALFGFQHVASERFLGLDVASERTF